MKKRFTKLSQRGGIDPYVIAAIVVAIIVGGFVFYRVINVDDTDEPANTEQTDESETPTVARGEISIDLTPGVSLIDEDDLAFLPAGAPLSFAEYMSGAVSGNNPDSSGCVSMYNVTQIKNASAKGSVETVSSTTKESSDQCFGAIGVSWYLFGGQWREISNQSADDCINSSVFSETEECITYLGYLSSPEADAEGEGSAVQRDTQRVNDIDILQGYVEAYQASNGYYPAAADLDDVDADAEFISEELRGMDPSSRVDPVSGEEYPYIATPEGCDNEAVTCSGYSITADLEADGTGPNDQDNNTADETRDNLI